MFLTEAVLPQMPPIVSIVVPFGGYLFRILNIHFVKPKKGTTMETIGSLHRLEALHLCMALSPKSRTPTRAPRDSHG